MVLVILLVLALFVIQTLMPERFRPRADAGTASKLAVALGPRDERPPQSQMGARAERALANMHEALPVFLALALLNLVVKTAGPLAINGAWVFLVARILYVPAYLSGITGVRTAIWIVGWVGLVLMLVPLLERI
jgi:uncharacterized MAPEG superfamily protein